MDENTMIVREDKSNNKKNKHRKRKKTKKKKYDSDNRAHWYSEGYKDRNDMIDFQHIILQEYDEQWQSNGLNNRNHKLPKKQNTTQYLQE